MSNVAKSAHNRKDLSGQSFGKLTVISYSHTENKRALWKCICQCGNSHIAIGKYLICGDTKSCGCEQNKFFITKHSEAGLNRSKEYRTWKSMKTRCLNKHSKEYKRYGGRGIKICQSWIDSFESFLYDMGRAPSPNHSLDRMDNNGDYNFFNCRWATSKEQNNNSSNCNFITMNGKTLSVAAWAESYNVSYIMVYKRLMRGWNLKEALETPSKQITSFYR